VTIPFFVLTFALAWSFWGGAALVLHGHASPAPATAAIASTLFLLGAISPSFSSLWLTWRTEGRAGVAALFRRIGHPAAAARWFVFAALYVLTLKLAAAGIHRLVTGAWPVFGQTPVVVMFAALLISTWVQAGEELGWRAYALPRMAARMGLGGASVVLGVIWAVWHLPLFFIPTTDTLGQSFPLYLTQVVAMSVTMAWLYWRVRGNLLPVMLLHAAANNTKDIVPSGVAGATQVFALSPSLIAWISAGLFWVGAVLFLVQMRRATTID
jgi:membrane protease YdiL (CAAX protease family)